MIKILSPSCKFHFKYAVAIENFLKADGFPIKAQNFCKMSLQKLLATPRGDLYKNVFSVKRKPGNMATLNHIIPTPPRVRIPFAEKMVMATILSIGTWFIPAWVLYHMPEYQKVERNKYNGV